MIIKVYVVTFFVLSQFIGVQQELRAGYCTKMRMDECLLVTHTTIVPSRLSETLRFLFVVRMHGIQTCVQDYRKFDGFNKYNVTFEACCDGYAKDSDNSCKPICMPNCAHGTCIAPNNCLCFKGFRGDTCNSACPINKWGHDCKSDCKCQNDAKCDPINGTCECSKGWIGALCEKPCPEGYYGYFCEEKCKCENNATCDHINGRCNCIAGYRGALCREKCPEGYYGHQCRDECKCQNNATCHHEDGSCKCILGWTGEICTERCDAWHFGESCSGICHCFNNGSCDVVTGQCTCPGGFYGETCEMECPLGTWGLNCSQECFCANGECNAFDGSCICFPGFNGQKCENRACPDNTWGENCTNECDCEQGMECQPQTGECWRSLESMGDCAIKENGSIEKLLKKKEVNMWMVAFVVSNSVTFLLLIVMGIAYHRKVLSMWNGIENEFLLPSYSELIKEDDRKEDDFPSSSS